MNFSTKYHLCVAYTLHAVCITLLMWGLVRSEGLARRVLSHRWLTTIGLGSYSIYLWQQLLVHPKQSGWVYCFPQNVLLTLAIAFTSYWVIERPMNNLKDRISV